MKIVAAGDIVSHCTLMNLVSQYLCQAQTSVGW